MEEKKVPRTDLIRSNNFISSVYVFISFIIFFSPIFILFDNYKYYEILKQFIYIIVSGVILFVVIFNGKIIINKFFINSGSRIDIVLLLCVIVFFIYLQIIKPYYNYLKIEAYIYSFFISSGIFFFSYIIKLNEKNIIKITNSFIISSYFISTTAILMINRGFRIPQYYTIDIKNQIGPTVLLSSVILLTNSLYNFNKKYNLLYFLAYLYGLIMLLILRSRASIVSILITSLFIWFLRIKKAKNKRRYFLISFLIFIIIIGNYSNVIKPIKYALFAGKNIYDIDSLSSNRYSRIIEGLNNFIKNPLFGYKELDFSRAHCSFLGYVIDLGLLGSWPLLFIYFYIVFIILFRKENDYIRCGYNSLFYIKPLFMGAYIVSLFEVNSPFGPGFLYYYLWFILGQYLQEDKICRKIKDLKNFDHCNNKYLQAYKNFRNFDLRV
jgi:hypothetical protein